jgi:hypothetical protein
LENIGVFRGCQSFFLGEFFNFRGMAETGTAAFLEEEAAFGSSIPFYTDWRASRVRKRPISPPGNSCLKCGSVA